MPKKCIGTLRINVQILALLELICIMKFGHESPWFSYICWHRYTSCINALSTVLVVDILVGLRKLLTRGGGPKHGKGVEGQCSHIYPQIAYFRDRSGYGAR